MQTGSERFFLCNATLPHFLSTRIVPLDDFFFPTHLYTRLPEAGAS